MTWALAGQAATGDVIEALGTDAFGGAMLAVAQLGLVPNLVLWAVSWLTGTGFAVGAGTMFAPDHVLGGPMPALPLLGALPTQAGGLLVWAPVVVVLVGALAGLRLHRGLEEEAPWQPLAAAVGCRRGRRGGHGGLAALSGGAARARAHGGGRSGIAARRAGHRCARAAGARPGGAGVCAGPRDGAPSHGTGRDRTSARADQDDGLEAVAARARVRARG